MACRIRLQSCNKDSVYLELAHKQQAPHKPTGQQGGATPTKHIQRQLHGVAGGAFVESYPGLTFPNFATPHFDWSLNLAKLRFGLLSM